MFSIALKSPAALGLIQPLAAAQTRPLMKIRRMCYPRWSGKLVSVGPPGAELGKGSGEGGGCENTLLVRCYLHVTRDMEIRDLGAPAQLGAGGMRQGLRGLPRRPRVGGAGVTPGVWLVGPWGAGPRSVVQGRGGLSGLSSPQWCYACARGSPLRCGAAMGPLGPTRRAARAPA